MNATKRHRRNAPPQSAERLLKILEANLAQATSPDLRERLERAIKALKERDDACAA